jgi:hypothetical protein
MKTEIEQRQTNRFIVLYEAYKDSNASTSVTVKIADLAALKGVKNGIYKEVITYLKDEGLISKEGAIREV